jgi:hypothetical protein
VPSVCDFENTEKKGPANNRSFAMADVRLWIANLTTSAPYRSSGPGLTMATERQIATNRRNASRGTGPHSRPGRKRAAGNATVHGLTTNLLSNAAFAEQVRETAISQNEPNLSE